MWGFYVSGGRAGVVAKAEVERGERAVGRV